MADRESMIMDDLDPEEDIEIKDIIKDLKTAKFQVLYNIPKDSVRYFERMKDEMTKEEQKEWLIKYL